VDLRFISHYAKFTNLETFSNFGQTITLGSKMNQMEEGGFGSKPAAGGPKFTPPTDDDGPKFGGPAPF
jgi:hypothetical protein